MGEMKPFDEGYEILTLETEGTIFESLEKDEKNISNNGFVDIIVLISVIITSGVLAFIITVLSRL